MWPDVSEYDANDLSEVPNVKMPDGSPGRLYSAFRKGPVLLHCKWMRQYGIDGVFVSRFIGEAASPTRARHVNTVLANLREGCHREGRVWAMMLDLSMGRRATTKVVMDDWKFLCDLVKVREDERYLHHKGKPVCCSGGWIQGPPLTPQQGEELIDSSRMTQSMAASTTGGSTILVNPSASSRLEAAGPRSIDPSTPSALDAGRLATMFRWTDPQTGMGRCAELKDANGATCRRHFRVFPGQLRRAQPGKTMTLAATESSTGGTAIFRELGIRTV